MEVVNDLLNFSDLKIVQNTEWFNFSLDSVLLANFVTLNKNISKIMDLGTGNAPIPLILTKKTNAKIYGVELQEEIYALACKSVELNKLNDRIELLNANFKDLSNFFFTDTFDVITCNPPYFKYDKNSNGNENKVKLIARHEKEGNLEDVLKISRKLLKNNGVFALVHRTDRLIEIIMLMKEYNIEPKRIQFIYPRIGKTSNIVLIEGKRNGKSGLKIEEPLYVHNENGKYSEDVLNLFKE